MINITDKAACCGCGACGNACPKNCINLQPDSEGFLYPVVNVAECVDCGLCESACPVLQNKAEAEKTQYAYVAQIKDKEVRKDSTSGGVFTAIAKYVIQQNGVVYGAAWDEFFVCKHIRVDKATDLGRFRNSKYVQSDMNNVHLSVRKDLETGRLVCFSGTPCQVESVKVYLGKKYDNLLLVDVVCRSVPSPLVWEKYLEMLKTGFSEEIGAVKFREKLYGYKYSALTVRDRSNHLMYAEGVDTDPYLRAFFSDMTVRPSCYDCKFKKRYRESDITIWDCYTVNTYDKKMDDDTGVTRVLCHSEHGKRVIDAVSDSLIITEVTADKLIEGVKEIMQSVSANTNREHFFLDLLDMPIEEVFAKWYPITAKTRLEKMLRRICLRLGIYKTINRFVKRVIKTRKHR